MNINPGKVNEKDAADAFDFMRRVDYILKIIREKKGGVLHEITEEERKKVVAIIKVEFPKGGGVLSHYEGLEYPTKGFPYGDTVNAVDRVKKVLMVTLRGIEESLKEHRIKTVLLFIFFRKQIFKIGDALLSTLNRGLEEVRSKPEMYCPAVREIYRAFNHIAKERKFFINLRDIICMVLEYDDAYRYRFQNVIIELDKERVQKNVVKEIRRLFERAIELEDDEGVKAKFIRLKKFLPIIRGQKALRDFLCGLDLSKLRMDRGDRYHAIFKGIKINEKEKKEEKI